MPSRNQEAYFSELPKVDIQRSIFNRPFSHKTSFNVGQVIPFYIDEVVPGDTHNITTSLVARLQTLLTPVMDNLYIDTYYFFVPMRLLWSHWKNFCGENEQGPWTKDQIKYTIPYLNYPEGSESSEGLVPAGFSLGSIADYMGIPVERSVADSADSRNKPSALPFRAYALVINEFFRDQNLQQPVVIHTDDTIRRGTKGSAVVQQPDGTFSEPYVTDLELGGFPFVAARFHDYFSSCLPAPQRSESVSIFGGFANASNTDAWSNNGPFAPVFAGENDFTDFGTGVPYALRGYYYQTGQSPTKYRITKQTSSNINYLSGTTSSTDASGSGFMPSNLWANLNIPEATITQLRLAFQLQRYFERAAVSGNRYREYLAGFFGVQNGDARMQVPEYLGGHRIPLSIHQVANTGKSQDGDLGDLGAMSNTSDVHEDFHSSFSEHGYILGLCVVRYDNTYSQGLERFWSRRDILDFYNPVFAHISEQPVYKREIAFGIPDFTGFVTEDSLNGVFGYNEAWADYRYKPSRVSGEMRPEVSNSLASWHLADDYAQVPYLGSQWIQTNAGTVDRVLAVGSQVANQVFCDIYVKNECVRPMPVHSIPGLADHF